MLQQPDAFANEAPPAKMPPHPKPALSPAQRLRDLHAHAGETGQYEGYLRSSVLSAVEAALTSLETDRNTVVGLPAAAFSANAAVLQYVALHLRAHDPFAKLHIRARNRKDLAEFLEATKAAGRDRTAALKK
jgi:hypothetical protein